MAWRSNARNVETDPEDTNSVAVFAYEEVRDEFINMKPRNFSALLRKAEVKPLMINGKRHFTYIEINKLFEFRKSQPGYQEPVIKGRRNEKRVRP